MVSEDVLTGTTTPGSPPAAMLPPVEPPAATLPPVELDPIFRERLPDEDHGEWREATYQRWLDAELTKPESERRWHPSDYARDLHAWYASTPEGVQRQEAAARNRRHETWKERLQLTSAAVLVLVIIAVVFGPHAIVTIWERIVRFINEELGGSP